MNVSSAQAKAAAQIRNRGALYTYEPVIQAFQSYNPAQPWRVGMPLAALAAGLNNVVNADYPNDPANLESITQPSTLNTPPLPIQVYMVFLDAKARGSSTQGMAAEFVSRTDVVGGNKVGLLAGSNGLTPQIGDQITGLVDGVQRTVKVAKFKVLAPTGVPILYTLEIEL